MMYKLFIENVGTSVPHSVVTLILSHFQICNSNDITFENTKKGKSAIVYIVDSWIDSEITEAIKNCGKYELRINKHVCWSMSLQLFNFPGVVIFNIQKRDMNDVLAFNPSYKNLSENVKNILEERLRVPIRSVKLMDRQSDSSKQYAFVTFKAIKCLSDEMNSIMTTIHRKHEKDEKPPSYDIMVYYPANTSDYHRYGIKMDELWYIQRKSKNRN